MKRLALIAACLSMLAGAALADMPSPLNPLGISQTWTPARLGSALAVWYDASDAATVLDAGGSPADDGEAVHTWQDKSGNGRHAYAATSPIVAEGALNGHAVLQTDGTASMIITNSTEIFRNKTAGYIWAVAYDADHAGGNGTHAVVTSIATGTTLRHGVYSRSATGKGWAARGRRLNADTLVNAYCGPTSGHTIVMGWADWAGGFVRTSTNGTACASTAYSSGAGNSEDFDGLDITLFRTYATDTAMPSGSQIATVIIANAPLTTAQIAAVNLYLSRRWGVALAQ